MDPRKLRYFLAVAEERHLGHAAQRLHMSQPPLTRQIQLLEEELGVVLFKRTPKGMLLTQAGEALLQDARNIQALVDQASQRARKAGAGQYGRLDIGVYGTAMFDSLPRLVKRYHAANPEVDIGIHPMQTPAQLQALRQGRLLVGFERMRPREDDLAEMLVLHEPLYLALPEDDELAQHAVIDIQWLRERRLLMPTASSSQLFNAGLDLCRANGFEPRWTNGTNDLFASTLMVAAGLGLCIVPECVRRLEQVPGLVIRPIAAAKPRYMSLYCFYRKDETSPLLSAFLKEVRRFSREEAQRLKQRVESA